MNKPDFIVPPEREIQENDLKTIAETRAEQLNIEHRRHAVWLRFVTVLAAIVVFCTTYALIIPAITWEKTLICEREEHVHSDVCYEDGVLVCGKEVHVHTDACFDAPPAAEGGYSCGKAEHTHGPDCYFEDGTLKCTLEEHVHNPKCVKIDLATAVRKLFAAPEENPPDVRHYVDPSTKNGLDAKFRVDGEYTADNDGKVVADKTVEWNGDTKESFKVTLSALGQSYQELVDVMERMHPDVLFVVDMSTSTYRNFMKNENGSDSSYTILEGIQSALNNSIDMLLEKDPLTRIGIVSFNASSNYGLKLDMGYYLRLPSDQNKEYVKLWKGNSSDRSSYSLYFNQNFQKAKFDGVSVDGDPILSANGYVNANGSNTRYATASGTYTQGGLYTGEGVFTNLFNGMTDLERSLRAPAMILITDGEPTQYTRNWKAPETNSTASSNTGSRPGYFTVMTAIGVKSRLTDLYDDYNNTFRLYTVGPGVVTKYGRAVLDPFGYSEDLDPVTGEKLTNLEACDGDTGNNKGYYPGDDFYEDMMNGFTAGGNSYLPYEQELAKEGYSADYADYADWSMSGSLTIEKLNKGMQKIIDDITAIPRPILVSSHSSMPNMIDPESFVEFTDVLGDGMTVVGTPVLYYNGDAYNGKLISEGVTSSDSDRRFRGWDYTLYSFTGKVTEESTNHTIDLSEIRAYVLKDPDTGKRVVEWLFPAEHLPIIFHDWRASGDEPEFRTVEPIRLAFDVKTISGLEPGHWYYSNSTDEITTCTFEVDPANPYKNEFGGEEEKSANNTETDENVSSYSKAGSKVTVTLGNNGKIFLDHFDLYVKKVWADSKNHDSDSVTVKLYRNNAYTGKSVTLKKSTGWTGVFEDLDAYDAGGAVYDYSVREDALTGTYASYITVYRKNQEFEYHRQWTEDVYTYSYSWKDIWNLGGSGTGNDFNTTDTYRLRLYSSGTTDTTLTNNNGSLSLTEMISSNPQISAAYTKQQWKFEKDGSGNWYLKSVFDGKYLGVQSGYVVLTDSSSRAKITRDNLKNSRKLTLNGGDLVSGSTTLYFTVEKLVVNEDVDHVPKEEDLDVIGTVIVNSPPVTVTLHKMDENGNIVPIAGAKFRLYYDKKLKDPVNSTTYQTDSTGTVKFENLYVGGEYWLKEVSPPEGYLMADEPQKFKVVSETDLNVDPSDRYLTKKGTTGLIVKMVNIRMYDLPPTGGIGIYPIVITGICLIAIPLIYFVLNPRRKRERRTEE